MAYLAAHGAFVPEPLPSQNGNLVEVISSPEGEWLAVAFTQAEGILSEEIPLDQWDDVQFQTLGRSIGKIHAIARGYVPSNEVSYPEWETGGNLFNRQIENELWLKEKQIPRAGANPRSAEASRCVRTRPLRLAFWEFLCGNPKADRHVDRLR